MSKTFFLRAVWRVHFVSTHFRNCANVESKHDDEDTRTRIRRTACVINIIRCIRDGHTGCVGGVVRPDRGFPRTGFSVSTFRTTRPINRSERARQIVQHIRLSVCRTSLFVSAAKTLFYYLHHASGPVRRLKGVRAGPVAMVGRTGVVPDNKLEEDVLCNVVNNAYEWL